MAKIVSIDDSKAVHAFLGECFKETNHQVEHFTESPKGLEYVLDQKDTIDLVLLDWEMPELTGPEVLTKLVEGGFTKPVIMLTSKNDVEDIASVLEKGAKEYIMKPFTRDIVLEKISPFLK
ncbi:MAG: hypothetical protein CMJ43_18645 [Phyllobacteriaceae bacterium]|nr:hypothetical protein [Phyllobacteriaceae bacterium]